MNKMKSEKMCIPIVIVRSALSKVIQSCTISMSRKYHNYYYYVSLLPWYYSYNAKSNLLSVQH